MTKVRLSFKIMAYGIGDQYKNQLLLLLTKQYLNKEMKITKFEPVRNQRGIGSTWENVDHVGRCISLKVDHIMTKNTNYPGYKISVKIIHHDLCQSKEWVTLNDSEVEILD